MSHPFCCATTLSLIVSPVIPRCPYEHRRDPIRRPCERCGERQAFIEGSEHCLHTRSRRLQIQGAGISQCDHVGEVTVDAEACTQCGEAYYSADNMRRLEQVRKDFVRKTITPPAVGRVYQLT